MAAAASGVELRGAAELGGDHDEGRVEHAVAFEVLEERGEGLIEVLDQEVLVPLAVVVGVPAAAVEEVQIVGDLDEADAGLDEAAGEEAALAELAAVGLAQGGAFAVEVEHVEKPGAGEAEGLAGDVGLGLDDGVGGVSLLVAFAEGGEEGFAAVLAGGVDVGGRTRPLGPISTWVR